MIDLRSDTVTKPTPEMRQAMAEAEVGDDVMGEDPTVNQREALAAEITGKEAAVFVASGTMANLCSLLAHTGRGDEVIVGHGSHIFVNEVASAAVVGGLQFQPMDDDSGHVTPAQVDEAIRGENVHWPRTRLVCLENTHNKAGGAVMDVAELEAVAELAHSRGLLAHLDGARLFNAATYLAVSAARLSAPFDSVYICLSKGLGAPVGSLTCGSREFIQRARKYRKMLGGGMRQAGIIAAAGIIALETMTKRLAEDHPTAGRIAEGIHDLPGIDLDLARVQTNILRLGFTRPELGGPQASAGLRERGILANAGGSTAMRLVTHHHVTMPDAEQVVAAFREVFASAAPRLAPATTATAGSAY
jgi:threonine aldolase